MSNNLIAIPGRLHSVALDEQGNPIPVSGANEIYDDELQLSQSTINDIVMSNAVTISLRATSNIVDSSVASNTSNTVTLVASTNINANIVIKKGNDVIASGTGSTLTATDTLAFSGQLTEYSAIVSKGDYQKTAIVRLATMYYGAGSTSLSAKYAKAVSSPAGTYNITVSSDGSYVFFRVPSTMTIHGATKSGFDYPLEDPVPSQIGGDEYKDYYSSNTYDAGTEIVTLS